MSDSYRCHVRAFLLWFLFFNERHHVDELQHALLSVYRTVFAPPPILPIFFSRSPRRYLPRDFAYRDFSYMLYSFSIMAAKLSLSNDSNSTISASSSKSSNDIPGSRFPPRPLLSLPPPDDDPIPCASSTPSSSSSSSTIRVPLSLPFLPDVSVFSWTTPVPCRWSPLLVSPCSGVSIGLPALMLNPYDWNSWVNVDGALQLAKKLRVPAHSCFEWIRCSRGSPASDGLG